jgi:hypothetical protein
LTAAAFHIAFSFEWVPELSPLERKRLWAAAIFLNASAADFTPLIFAGSADEPTMIKSLCMISCLLMP